MRKKNFMNVRVKIEVKDKKGKVIKVLEKDADLLTRQWGAFIAAFFKQWIDLTYANTYDCYDESGTSISLGGDTSIHTSDAYSPGFDSDMGTTLVICIGTGTTSPSVDDYNLESQVASEKPAAPSLDIDTGTGKIRVVFSATISPPTTPITITESGIKCVIEAVDAPYTCLICRDTFAGVDVPSGGSITVTYTFEFN